ncbi:hypothetical protein Rhopal_000881-T1 [Rhodotorula paludigena]|uniref:Acyl-protein thioesterase 1 n=1 Tax=Rhodotorula paludigena TaxID=86838 RepID=A0AAV5GE71_9BASI|nr:hypothetical protein Rhopal_000881-T1 [Rhodotorula paludigena]
MPKAQQSPLRWVLYGFAALCTLYAYVLWTTPPLGWEVNNQAMEAGTDLTVLGIGRHSASVIFMHGLGGTAQLGADEIADRLEMVERLRQELWQVSFVLPSAFDIDELTELGPDTPMPTREDETGMMKSVARIHALVQAEIDKGIEPDRIVVAGFSQGCVMSLLTGLTTKHHLGGIMCLSGWLPMAYKLDKSGGKWRHPWQTAHAHEAPVFYGHGEADNVVPVTWGEESIGLLHKIGFKDIEHHTYPALEHYMVKDEEKDIARWLRKILPPT